MDCFYLQYNGGLSKEWILYEEFEGPLKDAVEKEYNISWYDYCEEIDETDSFASYWISNLIRYTQLKQLYWAQHEYTNQIVYISRYKDISIRFETADITSKVDMSLYIRLENPRNLLIRKTTSSKSQLHILLNSITEMQSYIKQINLDKLNKIALTEADVIIQNYSMICKEREHTVKPYNGIIKLDDKKGNIVNYSVYVGYCKQCNKYFMFTEDFYDLLRAGKPLCQIIDYAPYYNDVGKSNEGLNSYNSQSILNQMGYNVNSNDNLSDESRQNILKNAIIQNKLSIHEVLTFLNWLICTRKNQSKYEQAIHKWRKDIEFIKSFENEKRDNIIITKITRN